MNQDALIDAMPHHICLVDKNGQILKTNKLWRSLFETSSENHDHTVDVVNILQTKGTVLDSTLLQEVLSGKSLSYEKEFQLFHSGLHSSFLLRVIPLDEQNSTAALMILEEKVTAEKRSEHQELLESMTDAFYAVDEDFLFTYMNEVAVAQLQLEKRYILGASLWDVFPDIVGSLLEEKLLLAVAQNTTSIFEYYYPPFESWYNIHVYPRKLGGLTVFFQNFTKQKQSELKLWESANYDGLTGLPNRARIFHLIEKMIDEDKNFTLLCMDIDNFQLINEIYGHAAGDNILRETSFRMQKLFNIDQVGRFGGDQLIFLLHTKDPEEIIVQANAVAEALKQVFFIEKETRVHITGSMSAARFPEDGDSVFKLVSAAEAALNEAKTNKAAKDIVYFYRSELTAQMRRSITIEKDLKNCFAAEDYFLVYQPQIEIISEKLTGMEVLSRWKHPELGYIPPPEFIAAAERTGQIQHLTERIIEAGLNQLLFWRQKYGYRGCIAFNVPSSLLISNQFMSFLLDIKHQLQIFDDIIEIEVTEDTDLGACKVMREQLQKLRDAGFIIAVDDFGTGYSKINYLNQFPFDKIKIDKSFIDEIGVSSKGEAVLNAVIALGRSLGLAIVAEGVETEAQRKFLSNSHCEQIQGYIYDAPVTADMMKERLAEKNFYRIKS